MRHSAGTLDGWLRGCCEALRAVRKTSVPPQKKPRPPSGHGFHPGNGYFQDLGADAAAAAGTSVLGGLLAVPGGECAPAASAGFAAGGV